MGNVVDGRSLVFGDDGSRGADVAWLWINNHHWPAWNIDVLTGTEPSDFSAEFGERTEPEVWIPPWGREYLHADDRATVTCRRSDDDPRVLLDEQAGADLIVVGHTGSGHLRSLWTGSTAEWLLHHPSAPLAIVRSAAKVERVTCCADGSDHARRALAAFVALPLSAGTEVTVLGVDDGRVDVDAAISDALTAFEGTGIEPTVERAAGKPAHVILEHLDAHRPQLVVLGTRGKTGWKRLRVGSTAAAVVRHADCTSLVACVEDD